MYIQPPLMTGVPVKSPSPPPCEAENAHALVSVGTTVVVSVFSAGCDRELDRSWPYAGQSPPGLLAGAQVVGRAETPAAVTAPAAGARRAREATTGSHRRDPSIKRPRSC